MIVTKRLFKKFIHLRHWTRADILIFFSMSQGKMGNGGLKES
jgi:hypothetical protein